MARRPKPDRRPAVRVAAAGVIVLLAAACSSGHGERSSPATAGTEPVTSATTAPTTSATAPATSPARTVPADESSTWTTYANGNARLGVAATQASLSPIHLAWQAPLDRAAVYAQPIVVDGRIIVATENDDVYALNPRDGRVLWSLNIGHPLIDVGAQAGCGDVDPLGITSTPVADARTGTVFVVGEVSSVGSPPVHHELVGIDVTTGRITQERDADPPLPGGENPVHLLQRAALALGSGIVYIGYGGNYGDCGNYHGWVVGVNESAGAGLNGRPAAALRAFDTTPDSSGGAVWMGGGGPSIDAAGNLYITTGNTNSSGPAPWSEAIVKLGADLSPTPLASFQDSTASDDEDLGTGDATLLPNGDVFAVGKTNHGYLLRQSDLAQVAALNGRVCDSDPDGGEAYDAATASLYVPCRGGGIRQINLSSLSLGWLASGANSTPILVDGVLWALDYPGGTLEAINPATGSVEQEIGVGGSVPNFASPAAALGLILVGTNAGIVALDGPAGPPSG
ncbi:MAG TPA: PQQ-binding-like beta-propeller repeat protein [Acidimicrobiales bacterium]|nr:PQQ-binding-like beta-propeller repeat protein [Acidimicrobiales bacterium]